MKKHVFINIITVIILVSFASKASAELITVLAPPEMKKPLQEISNHFQKEHKECFINFIFNNDNEIRNIIFKNPDVASIIINDNIYTHQQLVKNKTINSKSTKIIAKDKLCVVIKRDLPQRAYMLYPETTIFRALAVVNPYKTNTGKYTKEALTKLNLWQKLSTKLVFFDTNEQTIKQVSGGFYDGGVSYCSTAKNSFITISDYLNEKLHSKIIYSSAVKENIPENSNAWQFNNYLTSPTAKHIFKKYHFVL